MFSCYCGVFLCGVLLVESHFNVIAFAEACIYSKAFSHVYRFPCRLRCLRFRDPPPPMPNAPSMLKAPTPKPEDGLPIAPKSMVAPPKPKSPPPCRWRRPPLCCVPCPPMSSAAVNLVILPTKPLPPVFWMCCPCANRLARSADSRPLNSLSCPAFLIWSSSHVFVP